MIFVSPMKSQAKSFEDLDCWQHAAALRRRLDQRVKSFPVVEKYRLIDHTIRASRSSTANIAEGYGRFHFQENIQYCRQARGSLYELVDHLITAADVGYISKEELNAFKKDIKSCLALLNGYINYLIRAKGKKGN